MQLIPPPDVTVPGQTLGATRRTLMVLVLLALLAPCILYFGTIASIVTLWNRSGTFAHGYVVAPISLWLAWRQRDVLRTIPLQPYWPALGLAAIAGLAWLSATLGEVQVVRQYAVVAMFPLAVLAVCGRRFAAALTFPLLFLLFAVPAGEIFVPPLIDFTADFTIAALRLTGIPVLRNGPTFEIPSGNWSVVEACSGLRYLISSITLGCLYAYLSYRTWWRRALFIAVSVVVPILANGLRAYMIVMIGHLSSMRLAVGVDHIIYGWLFFGLVMFLMFSIGRLWQENEAPPAPRTAEPAMLYPLQPALFVRMTVAFVVMIALWPAFAALNGRLTAPPPGTRLAPVALTWQEVPAFTHWTPAFVAPDSRFDKTVTAGSAQVSLSILYYRNDDGSAPLITSVNRIANDPKNFHEIGTVQHQETIGGRPMSVLETTIAGPGGNLLAWHWLRIGGHETTNAYVGKAWQAGARLMLRAGDGAAVIAATPLTDGKDAARATLRAFLNDNRTTIDAALALTEKHQDAKR